MKHNQRVAVLCTAVLALTMLFAGALCRKQRVGGSQIQTESPLPPGTLIGVMYSCSGGMNIRNDFFIWLSPEAIVETFYYPEKPPKGVGWHERFDKENILITAEQWAEVEHAVLEIYPLMKPEPERKSGLWSRLGHWFGAVDGNDSLSITLIWNTEVGEQKIRYSFTDDDRIHALITLLKELADPTGREIPRYAL